MYTYIIFKRKEPQHVKYTNPCTLQPNDLYTQVVPVQT